MNEKISKSGSFHNNCDHYDHLEKISGIVERITFHNTENGWSVLKVSPFNSPQTLVTVLIHQAEVFAGSSMEFLGVWNRHPKHGEQFKAQQAIEKKPASAAAMEKYLGSGLIKNVGPKTAAKIVRFFKEDTLRVFEEAADDLLKVPGIAQKKLTDIKNSWQEHKAIRDVMLFLQSYGISTLFAVKIYREYGDQAIAIVSNNPYQLAKDIYGIGFFSADRIALKMGFEQDGNCRIEAGIKHVLAASRQEGHCYLTAEQIISNTAEILQLEQQQITDKIKALLDSLLQSQEIKERILPGNNDQFKIIAYYSNSLYFDEQYVATRVRKSIAQTIAIDIKRVKKWIESYCLRQEIKLSSEQQESVTGIVSKSFSILTGGPGCGKTTTTKVLVKLLHAMKKKFILAAPTGRAAQRMTEVTGHEAKTIHRLLEWAPGKNGFKKSEDNPLQLDFLIVDECSMLDINLAASLFKAVPQNAQILFIGDPDQLPSVGAGNVLSDLLQAGNMQSGNKSDLLQAGNMQSGNTQTGNKVAVFHLSKIFRQAAKSGIIRFAHQINQGEIPKIESPFYRPDLWQEKADCLFIDAEEATLEQIRFLQKAKLIMQDTAKSGEEYVIQTGDKVTGMITKKADEIKIENLLVQEFVSESEIKNPLFIIPEKFKHLDLEKLYSIQNQNQEQKSRKDIAIEELRSILKSVHPWSALHYNMTALDTILRIYTKTIPQYFGKEIEIQLLTPQVRGSLGAINLNLTLQNMVNPQRDGVKQLKIGDKIFREGDRVIQTRNNYDLGVYNGDIGIIKSINFENYTCQIRFGKILDKSSPIILYKKEDLTEISLAYGITIHKSQGSEFDAVIIPVATQHFKMLFRNLIYTGLTRAKKLCVFVGSRKALAMAIKQIDNRKRQTALDLLINRPVYT
jgi:exodeoxyribonuclease V alpha subunit